MTIQDHFNNFFTTYNGQGNVGDNDVNKGQCVGLIEVFTDSLNLPHTYGNAYQLMDNADPNHFQKILNTPNNSPEVGDIIVWQQGFNHINGHCGIASGHADVNQFDCFEQNDPIGSVCHIKTYNYSYVQGWLRPILPPEPPPPSPTTEMLTDDEKRALQVLRDEHLKHPEFQQLEALTRDLVEKYEHPQVTPAPPVVTTVVVEPQFKSQIAKALYGLAKSFG